MQPIKTRTAMQSHALHHARTYPVATQKGVADLCLYVSFTMHVQMYVHIETDIDMYNQ